MLLPAVVAGLSRRTAGDVVMVVFLAAFLAVLIVWPRLWPWRQDLDAEVRAAYSATFAGLGHAIVEVTPLHTEPELFQLLLLIAPTAAGAATGDDELSAAATLVGLNAMERWPGLTSFEARLARHGDGGPAVRLVVLARGHHRPAGVDQPPRP